MKLHQLSLFLENKPGQMRLPCQALGSAGIDILTLCLADTQQFSILRLIVRDWERARKVLQDAGCAVNVTEVLALDVDDQAGGLAGVLDILAAAGLSIDYMYAFTRGRRSGKAALIFRFENPDAATEVLRRHGAAILTPEELYARMEA